MNTCTFEIGIKKLMDLCAENSNKNGYAINKTDKKLGQSKLDQLI